MSTTDIHPAAYAQDRHPDGPMGWLSRAEAWLDDRGKGAWIAVMVLAFIFVWPVGLAILAYMIWSKRMFNTSCNRSARRSSMKSARMAMRPSGNRAFDAYKSDTLSRLEDEQASFESFLHRLREAKDKAEFDAFMEERAGNAATRADDRRDGTDETAA